MHISFFPWRHHCSGVFFSLNSEVGPLLSADTQTSFCWLSCLPLFVCLKWKYWCKFWSCKVPAGWHLMSFMSLSLSWALINCSSTSLAMCKWRAAFNKFNYLNKAIFFAYGIFWLYFHLEVTKHSLLIDSQPHSFPLCVYYDWGHQYSSLHPYPKMIYSITRAAKVCLLFPSNRQYSELIVMFKKPVWDDMSFVTWCIILLEVAIRRWVHCGQIGMDMVSNNTQVGCSI